MGLEVIESLNPKLLDSSTEIVRSWRGRLYDELSRRKARKEIRQLVDQGAILYVVDGQVADYICLQGRDFEELEPGRLEELRSKLAGLVVEHGLVSGIVGDWQALWLEPMRDRGRDVGFDPQVWDTEARCAEDVDMQKRAGYSPKYRHSNHSQEVRHSLGVLAQQLSRGEVD